MATELQEKILKYLEHTESTDSLQLAEQFGEDHQKIVGAIKSLQSVGDVIKAEQLSSCKYQLTPEGEGIVKNGSHEAIVYSLVPDGQGILQTDLLKLAGASAKIGFSKALQNGWIKIFKQNEGQNYVFREADFIEDRVCENLESLSLGEDKVHINTINEYKKRKLVQQILITSFNISRGPNFRTLIEKLETDLTPELMSSKEWRNKKFKPYNFRALGAPIPSGHLHPLLKVRSEFRQIFLEMGFSEMPTNRYVESSFWNFDALYVPQKHPARDLQDTFFLSRPRTTNSIPEEYREKVAKVHEHGDYGSLGYRYQWKSDEAMKNVLRTHTTAISARMLHAIGQKDKFEPVKFFSIDRVFRNETLDATHLAEFHQVEGIVADRNITLGHLLGIMKVFFGRLGIEQLRFKPTFNPYTEPSLEVFAYHPGLKRWVEIANSGMFRPEMLLPMGLPPDVKVLGWGLSLERPTMIRYGIENIRDLVGPKVDLQMVYDNSLCRLDKF